MRGSNNLMSKPQFDRSLIDCQLNSLVRNREKLMCIFLEVVEGLKFNKNSNFFPGTKSCKCSTQCTPER